MFEIKGLRFKHILKIDQLVIDHPITCIVGASGSGKTTLLRHLNKLYLPEQGEILYDGQPLDGINPVELRRRVVMLSQTPVLYDGTVGDNLKVGLRFSQKPSAAPAALEEILDQVGLRKSPADWCDKLSGGEKQRLCLARVLLMDAETYLLDEPSAALDRDTERFIIDHLTEFVRRRGKQLIIVTHSDSIADRYPDSRIRMTAGQTGGYAQ